MKQAIGIIISVLIAVMSSSFSDVLSLSGDTISTLYTISGIMFSIGMSLLVTSNTSDVKNKRFKEAIRRQMNLISGRYLFCFAIISFLYILLYSGIKDGVFCLYKNIVLNYSDLLVVMMSYSIFYFTINFLSLRRLNAQIEDAE